MDQRSKFTATGCSQSTRHCPNNPRSVIQADSPRNTATTTDFRLPVPMRISVLLPQPEPRVMPMPNSSPPTRCDSHIRFGPT